MLVVRALFIVSALITGVPLDRTTVPAVPVVARLCKTPPLWYRKNPEVPPEIAVLPIVKPELPPDALSVPLVMLRLEPRFKHCDGKADPPPYRSCTLVHVDVCKLCGTCVTVGA